jgi:hypothetical protein
MRKIPTTFKRLRLTTTKRVMSELSVGECEIY